MNNFDLKKLIWLFLLVLLGCTRQVPVAVPLYKPDIFFRSGAVGIYMSPELKDYKCEISPLNDCSFNIYFCAFNTYVYPLGEQVAEALKTVTGSLFKDVYFYVSLEEFERDYKIGKFQQILSVKSIEGTVKVSTKRDSWRCYQPLFDFAPKGMPLVSSCRMRVVLVSRKANNGKLFTFTIEASGKDRITTPSLRCSPEYFAPAANQALSDLASKYAQMITHIF